jgi:enamine deaminase RidA (YjgF/YER057c/UK114 family)
MTKRFIELPGLREAYMATLTPIIPEYKPISIAHGVVTEGGKTLRMSGWPAIGPGGIIGKGDMRAQTLQAMDYVRQTIEAAGATCDRAPPSRLGAQVGQRGC